MLWIKTNHRWLHVVAQKYVSKVHFANRIYQTLVISDVTTFLEFDSVTAIVHYELSGTKKEKSDYVLKWLFEVFYEGFHEN